MNNYDQNSAAYRSEANKAAERYNQTNTPTQTWPGGTAALHAPDIVVGGDPKVIVGFGDREINSSIGGSWRGSRKEYLRVYAKEMQARGCPMDVMLDTCGNDIFIGRRMPPMTA